MLDTISLDNFIIDLINEDDMSEESDSSSVHSGQYGFDAEEDSSDQEDSSVSDSDEDDGESTDDELIQNIVSRQNASSSNPNSIKINTVATDLSFHPDKNVLAVSNMEGHLLFYDVDDNSTKINDISVHADNIRSLDFFPDGSRVASVSSDGTFYFTDVEKKRKIPVNIDSEVDLEFYSVRTLTNDVCVTGHENGCIRLWDVRSASQINSVEASDDTIIFIHYSSNVGRIHVTTGHGELIIYDVRSLKKFKPLRKSDPHTSELTCCTTVRSDRNIICGTGRGELLLFDWEPFDYHTYKPNALKKEILSIIGATENIVITGNENGNINAYHLYPNQPIGLIGSHDKWDITKLDINHSGFILSSLAEDEIKFWDISFLEYVESFISKNKEQDKTSYALPSSQVMSRQEFFSDLNDDENT